MELSISSVEAQLNKYQELLEHCSSEDAIVNLMSSFPLNMDASTTPRNYMVPNFSRPSATLRANGKLWKKVANLHLHGGEEVHIRGGLYTY
jgi:hypothetical protein